MYDWLIVGAGFAGSVLAERLASERNERVLLIDRRPHIGGNAYDRYDDDGLLIHQYGPHIFHTNSKQIFDHLSRFTEWRFYEHRVLAEVDGMQVPIPINLDTVNKLYGLNLTSEELQDWFAERAEPVDEIRDLRGRGGLRRRARALREVLPRLYAQAMGPRPLRTRQVGDLARADAHEPGRPLLRRRVPVHAEARLHAHVREDGQPSEHPRDDADRLRRRASTSFPTGASSITGPIDEYFDFRFGKLPYRSLRFEHVTLDKAWHQPVGVVNYPQTQDYTRVTEYKHLTGQEHAKTALTYEYPSAEGDPYYPIPKPENQELFKKYERLALATPDVWFVGRLATYRYYNMDQIVGQALATFRRINEALPVGADTSAVKVVSPSAAMAS